MLSDSILVTVRVMCNVDEADSGFDMQLIPLINSQLMMAHEFGVGRDGMIVYGTSETWEELLGWERGALLSAIQTWLGYSVRLLFDPPDNSTVLKSYQDQIAKMEWMLRSKSERTGLVKEYVPDKAAFYEEIEQVVSKDFDRIDGTEDEDETAYSEG